MSLNPAIAKQKPNGNVQCLICNQEVKPKIWTAHVNGKKHRQNIELLKEKTSSKRAQNGGGAQSRNDEPPNKKYRELPKEGPTTIPSDFFDTEASTTSFRQKEDYDNNKTSGNDDNNGLPSGFFDDKKLDDKSKESREKNAQLDAEFEKWREEIGEEQSDREKQKEQKEAAEQRELELERIDEQMEALRKLNEMEIQKEKRLNQAIERRKQREAERMEAETAAADQEDADTDIDLDVLDWRSKDIFS